jgi:ATP-dependent DNA ligase
MCKVQNFIEDCLRMVVVEGGEGVILRKHGSPYAHGRSINLIKIKVCFITCAAEITVVQWKKYAQYNESLSVGFTNKLAVREFCIYSSILLQMITLLRKFKH